MQKQDIEEIIKKLLEDFKKEAEESLKKLKI